MLVWSPGVTGRFRDRSLRRAPDASLARNPARARDRRVDPSDGRFPDRLSNRFLAPDELRRDSRSHQPWGAHELFADGQWQDIRAGLERQGWNCSQIEMVHDQLRQGWPLPMAKHNVSALTGHCPLRSRHLS